MTSQFWSKALIRMVAGLGGGFILGALSGFWRGIETTDALLFGLFCALSGLVAGAIGHLLFAGPGTASSVRSVVNYSVIGATFFTCLSLATPESLAELMNIQGPTASIVAGLIGGATGGVMFVILQGGYAGVKPASAEKA